MPIFEQGYQHWQGRLANHAWASVAIARRGVQSQFRSRWTKWVVFGAWVPGLALAAALILWGLFEQQASFLQPLVRMMEGLPAALREGPKNFRLTMWQVIFFGFFQVQTFFSMLLVLFVGPGLISQDLRFNAVPLYFSRPLRRVDYFLGKLGIIGVYLAAVAVVPVVLAYVLGVCFSLDPGVVWETGRLLGASLVFGLVVVASAGMLMLAISSLSRNSRFVGAIWIGLWIVSNTLAGVLTGITENRRYLLLSYTSNLHRLCDALLGMNDAWRQLGGLFPSGRNGPRWEEMADPFPWYWSAGVLAALFGLSVWILTLRVKSLDRLK
jgi:ABC-2 type transport system permease protein